MLELYDDLMTADEACEALRIGKNALYRLLNNHNLKAYQDGGSGASPPSGGGVHPHPSEVIKKHPGRNSVQGVLRLIFKKER